jgi:hypothetical protein
LSNPSIKRPTSTQFESYHFTDEDANERKSLISRIGSSQADPPLGKKSPDGGAPKEPGNTSRLEGAESAEEENKSEGPVIDNDEFTI